MAIAEPTDPSAHEQVVLAGDVTDSLKALLHDRGIRQQDLAKLLGVSAAQVSRVLSADSNMTLATLARIGFHLGVRFVVVPTARPGFDVPGWAADRARELADG